MKKIGFDLVEVARFKKEVKKGGTGKNSAFIKKVFTKSEIDYCFSFADPETHLAGMFAAKEAVSKALGTAAFPFIEIEIRHAKSGAPVAYKNDKPLKISVSISHTGIIAGAVAAA